MKNSDYILSLSHDINLSYTLELSNPLHDKIGRFAKATGLKVVKKVKNLKLKNTAKALGSTLDETAFEKLGVHPSYVLGHIHILKEKLKGKNLKKFGSHVTRLFQRKK